MIRTLSLAAFFGTALLATYPAKAASTVSPPEGSATSIDLVQYWGDGYRPRYRDEDEDWRRRRDWERRRWQESDWRREHWRREHERRYDRRPDNDDDD